MCSVGVTGETELSQQSSLKSTAIAVRVQTLPTHMHRLLSECVGCERLCTSHGGVGTFWMTLEGQFCLTRHPHTICSCCLLTGMLWRTQCLQEGLAREQQKDKHYMDLQTVQIGLCTFACGLLLCLLQWLHDFLTEVTTGQKLWLSDSNMLINPSVCEEAKLLGKENGYLKRKLNGTVVFQRGVIAVGGANG